MKSSAVETMERDMPESAYHFFKGNFNGCLTVLKQAESMADQRGDVEMRFQSLKNQTGLFYPSTISAIW